MVFTISCLDTWSSARSSFWKVDEPIVPGLQSVSCESLRKDLDKYNHRFPCILVIPIKMSPEATTDNPYVLAVLANFMSTWHMPVSSEWKEPIVESNFSSRSVWGKTWRTFFYLWTCPDHFAWNHPSPIV